MEVPQRLISLEKKICQITVCSLESKCKGIRWTGAVQILWNPALRSPCVYGQSFIMVTLLSPKQKSSQSFSYSKKSFNMPRRHPDNRDLKQTTMATATRTLQNKRFNKQNNALHVRFNALYISQPSSAKQQREMTKFWIFWRTCFHLELNAGITHQAWASHVTHRRTEQI